MNAGTRRPSVVLIAALLVAAMLAAASSGSGQSTTTSRAMARARQALEAGDAAAAVAVLEATLRSDPGAIEVAELLARALDAGGRRDEAKRAAEGVLRAFPGCTATRLWLAQFLELSLIHI